MKTLQTEPKFVLLDCIRQSLSYCRGALTPRKFIPVIRCTTTCCHYAECIELL